MSALTEIEKLVNEITKAALTGGNAIPFHDKVEALKVLTPYFVALRKDRDDIVPSGETMADFATAMKEHDDAPVRSRRRNGRPSSERDNSERDT